MKTLATLVRHNVTYLVGLLVAWLVSHLTLPADIQAVTEAGDAIIAPLSLLAGAVAVVVSRLLLTWAGTLFRTGAGEESSRPSGGMVPLVVIGLGLSMAAVGTLPSCGPGLAGAEYPVRGFVTYTDPQTGAQVGFQVGEPPKATKPKKAKAPKIIPAK